MIFIILLLMEIQNDNNNENKEIGDIIKWSIWSKV